MAERGYIIVMMGKMPGGENSRNVKTMTICVTEDCNLKCTYCYMCKKNDKRVLKWDIAKEIIDFFLDQNWDQEYADFDFIGGEPFLEMELISKITDYIKIRTYELGHKWFGKYRFTFSTNGILYGDPIVQDYIKRNKDYVSIGISIDGNREKHNSCRIYKDGRGSYDDVMKNVALWQKQFPNEGTKATFSKGDLPLLKESIISLWDNGVHVVFANLVFDDYWTEDDASLYETELKSLADYIIVNNLEDKRYVRFFDLSIGEPVDAELKKMNYCGSGLMIASDIEGNLYPCIRFLDFTMNNKQSRSIGNIHDGINENKLRSFLALTYETQSKPECNECQIATGCAWCTAQNYDDSFDSSIYQRSLSLCKMHKANVNANNYFWEKLSLLRGTSNPKVEERVERLKYSGRNLIIIKNSRAIPICEYGNKIADDIVMSSKLFREALLFSEKEGYIPLIIDINIDDHTILSDSFGNILAQSAVNESVTDNVMTKNIVVTHDGLANVFNLVIESIDKDVARLNIIVLDPDIISESQITIYERELAKINEWVYDLLLKNKTIPAINIYDSVFENNTQEYSEGCECGLKSIAVGPNGNFYICPGYYFENQSPIGNIYDKNFVLPEKRLFERKYSPICRECKINNCSRCNLVSVLNTLEFNVPSKGMCKIRHVERKNAKELQIKLLSNGQKLEGRLIEDVISFDPLEQLLGLNTKTNC